MGPAHRGPVNVSSGKAYKLLADYLFSGSLPWKSGSSLIIMTFALLGWFNFQAHFVCNVILMLGRSTIKWRQRPDMTIAVGLDTKQRFNQTRFRPRFFQNQYLAQYM